MMTKTCAYCGKEITEKNEKAPLPRKVNGELYKRHCCKNPDWRYCSDEGCICEENRTCLNCGKYFGVVEW